MPEASKKLPTELLKQTSRSFYLTLRVLPRAIRSQIGLAYLLARTTDTIADTELVPVEKRLGALEEFQQFIKNGKCRPLGFGELVKSQASPAEQRLLENREYLLAILHSDTSPEDRARIIHVLDTITSGQKLDLRRFAGISDGLRVSSPAASSNFSSAAAGDSRAPNIIALKTDAELDDYTYRVAGCVGEFWTDMCIGHLFPSPEPDTAVGGTFKESGVRFGKGLQLVNILRDLPADLRKGRCYLPAAKLAEAGLNPGDLLSPVNEIKFRPLYNHYLDLAESHLTAGWDYTNLIPFGHMRVRLACAWPILIGAKTIERLRTATVLDGSQRVKINRAEVRGIIARSVLLYPFPAAWEKMLLVPRKGKDVASPAVLA